VTHIVSGAARKRKSKMKSKIMKWIKRKSRTQVAALPSSLPATSYS